MTFMSKAGPMRDSIRRSLEYQRVWYSHCPGMTENSYTLTIEREGRRYSDTFHLESDADVNRALNHLEAQANR